MKRISVLLLMSALIISSCSLLSPTRNILGTWHTTTPVKVYIETDYQDFVNMELVATEYWDIEMEITSTGLDANAVYVNWTFTRSGYEALVSDPGVVPEVSPMFLTGTIDGDRLIISSSDDSTFAELSYLTDYMEGFIDYSWTAGWSQRDYTIPNELHFEKE